MHFAAPWALLALLFTPLLIWRALRRSGRAASALRFSDLRVVSGYRAQLRPLVASLLPWMRIAAFVLLVLALARPQSQASLEKETTEGIDIMLTMDISGSMLAEDFKPKTRFVVAKETLTRFALQTENDRLGLVIFARKAFTQCPLTLDHEMVAQLVGQVEQGMIEDGTAIGMAIATAAHRLRESKAKSRVIILMTDGMNNAGKIDPITAAKAAAALGIRIYAVGVGKEGGAPIAVNQGLLGKQYLRNPDGSLQLSQIDEATLKQIAEIGKGKYFRATDAEAMAKIYADIRKLEKSRFQIQKRRPVVEEFARYLWPALVLLLLQMALGLTYARKAP